MRASKVAWTSPVLLVVAAYWLFVDYGNTVHGDISLRSFLLIAMWSAPAYLAINSFKEVATKSIATSLALLLVTISLQGLFSDSHSTAGAGVILYPVVFLLAAVVARVVTFRPTENGT